jgi:DUF4097 and DUF4098 domain-containing protein YvlB
MKFLPVLIAALLLSGCEFGDFGPSDRYQTDFHYSYDISPDARIDVESLNGAIEISGWDDNKVDISGTKYGSTEQLRDSLKIEIHNTPNSLDVRTVRPSSRIGSLGVRYVIRVPRKALLDRITTSNARIQVRDVANAAHLKSSNGSIRAENIAGDVEAHTSNSSIDLDSVRGNAQLRSSNGRIHADNIGGECNAETSNSSIKIRLETAPTTPIRLVTSNGSIDLTLEKAPKNDIRAETRNSSITLHLPNSTSARLTADTSNSSISSDFEMRTELHDDHRKNHLDGSIGSGSGPRIELSSSNGHIRIVKGSGD